MGPELAVLLTARNEADRVGETLAALSAAFPGAPLVVADDASVDATAQVAREGGAEVVTAPRPLGKGGAATLGARRLLERHSQGAERPGALKVLLCDGDLGRSAGALRGLVEALDRDEGDLAVASFARRVGGGFGLAVGAARAVIRTRAGLDPLSPISGQRAMAADVLRVVIPFAPGFGMETAMTIDAHRAGYRLVEVELELEHRATGRTVAGFAHRARQLRDIVRVYASRR